MLLTPPDAAVVPSELELELGLELDEAVADEAEPALDVGVLTAVAALVAVAVDAGDDEEEAPFVGLNCCLSRLQAPTSVVSDAELARAAGVEPQFVYCCR